MGQARAVAGTDLLWCGVQLFQVLGKNPKVLCSRPILHQARDLTCIHHCRVVVTSVTCLQRLLGFLGFRECKDELHQHHITLCAAYSDEILFRVSGLP